MRVLAGAGGRGAPGRTALGKAQIPHRCEVSQQSSHSGYPPSLCSNFTPGPRSSARSRPGRPRRYRPGGQLGNRALCARARKRPLQHAVKNPADKIFYRQNKPAIEHACWQTHTSDLFSHACFEVSRLGGRRRGGGAGWAWRHQRKRNGHSRLEARKITTVMN